MDETRRSRARGFADALATAHRARLRAEADELLHLTELAAVYTVGYDDVVEVLVEDRLRVGGKGTPSVSEFLCLEVAALLGCSAMAAAARVADALDLRWRHPGLWAQVQALVLDAGRGLKAAHRCRGLDPETAEAVGTTWGQRQQHLGWKAAFDLLDELVMAADPGEAAVAEDAAAGARRVVVGHGDDGVSDVYACLDVLDGVLLDGVLDEFAGILAGGGVVATRQQLRSKALGILAVPGLALRIQQQALQQPLLDPAPAVAEAAGLPQSLAGFLALDDDQVATLAEAQDRAWDITHPLHTGTLDEYLNTITDTGQTAGAGTAAGRTAGAAAGTAAGRTAGAGAGTAAGRTAGAAAGTAAGRTAGAAAGTVAGDIDTPAEHGTGCLGYRCGTITVPAARLAPKVRLVVHMDAADIAAYDDGVLRGSAWIEHIGSVTLASLKRLLDGKQVTCQPVIDLNNTTAEDQHRPSSRLAEAVRLLHPHEAFPYSTRRSVSCDLDHTISYQPARGPGQTRLDNLAPLTRKTHRAKTLGAWQLHQPTTGVLEWTSPLGYQYRLTPAATTPHT